MITKMIVFLAEGGRCMIKSINVLSYTMPGLIEAFRGLVGHKWAAFTWE